MKQQGALTRLRARDDGCGPPSVQLGGPQPRQSPLALDRLGDAAPMAPDTALELVVGWGIVAAISAVGDYAVSLAPDLRLDLRYDDRQDVPVIWIAGQRLGVDGELPALRAARLGRMLLSLW